MGFEIVLLELPQRLLSGTHQKAAVDSVHFPLWTYNPTTGKLKLDSADKSDTVSFAKNAISKELGVLPRPSFTLSSAVSGSGPDPRDLL